MHCITPLLLLSVLCHERGTESTRGSQKKKGDLLNDREKSTRRPSHIKKWCCSGGLWCTRRTHTCSLPGDSPTMTMPQSVCRYWLVTQTSSPLARSTGRRKTGTLVGSNAPDECNYTLSGSVALHYRVSVAQSSCQCILRFRGAESQSCPTHPQRNQTTARSVRCTPKSEIERVTRCV
jgi:hypothetical protein